MKMIIKLHIEDLSDILLAAQKPSDGRMFDSALQRSDRSLVNGDYNSDFGERSRHKHEMFDPSMVYETPRLPVVFVLGK